MHPFHQRVIEIIKAAPETGFAEAAEKAAQENPASYEDYRKALRRGANGPSGSPVIELLGAKAPHAFEVLSETVAANEGIALIDAHARVAASRPDLYESYRISVMRS